MYQKSETSQEINLSLWNLVCVTDPDVTKDVNVGRQFTAICAQSQIKKATLLWGPIGGEWGVRDERHNVIENYCIYTAELYYPGGSIQIHADIEIIFYAGKRKGMYNEDFTKKTATDALTKGLSRLGFNADIFEGKFDDNKYVAGLRAQKKGGEEQGKTGKQGQAGKKTGGPSDNGDYQKLRTEFTNILKAFTEKEQKQGEAMAGKISPKDTKSMENLIKLWKLKKPPAETNAQEAVQKVFGDGVDNPDNAVVDNQVDNSVDKVPDDFNDDIPF